MAETGNQISKRRPRRLPWTVFGVVGLAVAIAGCGGYSSTNSSHAHGAKAASPAAGASSASAIPQGNGGDMDADNNGGPNDGDGNQ